MGRIMLSKTIPELQGIIKNGDAEQQAYLTDILRAITEKNPDRILQDIEKTSGLFDYYQTYDEYKKKSISDLRGLLDNINILPVINILIILHLISAIKKKSKVKWWKYDPEKIEENQKKNYSIIIETLKGIFSTWAPPPSLTISQWADAHRVLSPESSAEPGQWMTERAEYQRGIMDAFNEPEAEDIIIVSSSQVGKTEILNNVVGYYIEQDPSPLMVVQPTLEMAQAWSKDRLAPMLRDTPVLQGKVKSVRSRDSENTILHKVFHGGNLTISGSNSPASLAGRPKRIGIGDDVDRWSASAGTEGDPVKLFFKRMTAFWNSKRALFSTPTNQNSRIWKAFQETDKRYYYVPCPTW